jgi:Rrf2 family protein
MKKSYILKKAIKENVLLSQTTIYALRTVGFIAKSNPDQPVLSSRLSEQLEIPQNYLSKIMHRLVQAGYLVSKRGTNGGFLLAKKADKIAIKDIVSLFMNIEQFDKCFLGKIKCDGSCGLHDQWEPIIREFKKLINKNTVDRLF